MGEARRHQLLAELVRLSEHGRQILQNLENPAAYRPAADVVSSSPSFAASLRIAGRSSRYCSTSASVRCLNTRSPRQRGH
jgi:hypothetical protein